MSTVRQSRHLTPCYGYFTVMGKLELFGTLNRKPDHTFSAIVLGITTSESLH